MSGTISSNKHSKRTKFSAGRKYVWTVGIGLMLLLLNCYFEGFAFNPLTANNIDANEKDSSVLRFMTYNVWSVGPYMTSHKDKPAVELINSIDSMKIDVLLMCELVPHMNPKVVDSLRSKFKYSTISLSENLKTEPVLVYSRYPISELRQIPFLDTLGRKTSEPTLWMMKLESPKGIINLITCHLTSNGYDKIRNQNKGSESFSRRMGKYLDGVKKGYKCRKAEAEAIRDSIDCLSGPIIVMGDFNDISGSYVLKHIQGKTLADSWWNGGFGFGFTYAMHHLWLRLDHMLYSKNHFKLKGVKVLDEWCYSDHYPLVVDLALQL